MLTSRDVALCIARYGVGLALTGHNTAGLARRRAYRNAWQHVRRVLTRHGGHGRASPPTLVPDTEQLGWQAEQIPRLRNAEQMSAGPR